MKIGWKAKRRGIGVKGIDVIPARLVIEYGGKARICIWGLERVTAGKPGEKREIFDRRQASAGYSSGIGYFIGIALACGEPESG